MTLQKKDFIEIEFTGRLKDTGEVFDSNIKEELEKLHKDHNHPIEAKPLIYCLGEGMFLEGVDNYLIGKEIGKHQFDLSSENAFGKRNSLLIQKIPIKIFTQHRLNPTPGAIFNFDGRRGKVLSVSGGRVLVDFNHPLAGKDVTYEIDIKKIVKDSKEKIKAFNFFLFRKELNFVIEGQKVIYSVDENMKKFLELFRDKFREIFGMDLEIKGLNFASGSEKSVKETS